MNRKPGFPNSSCSIKLPDGSSTKDDIGVNDDENSYKKRQQLITFGHTQWGFDNWSWGVTKQDLDFADYANGKYTAGVVAFVSISVKSLGIHREDVGYATCVSSQKGGAIYSARKCSVTNALRETLLSFGGEVASALLALLETKKSEGQSDEISIPKSEIKTEVNGRNNNASDGQVASSVNRNSQHGRLQRKDSSDSSTSNENKLAKKEAGSPQRQNPSSSAYKNCSNSGRNNTNQIETISHVANHSSNVKVIGPTANHNSVKLVPSTVPPLVPSTMPVGGMPPPPMGVRPPVPLHPSDVSYVVQRIMPPLYSLQCATPPPPYHNTYFTEYAPWPITYDNVERHHANNNYTIPPKNFVSNNRSTNDCSRSCNSSYRNSVGESVANNCNSQPVNMNGTWIKPTIFYDGFWTEQKVKQWVSEQNEKCSGGEDPTPNGGSAGKTNPTNNIQNQLCHSKA